MSTLYPRTQAPRLDGDCRQRFLQNRRRYRCSRLWLAALASASLLSCGAPLEEASMAPQSGLPPTEGEIAASEDAADLAVGTSLEATPTPTVPQLIKTAELTLRVAAIEPAVQAATAIAQQRGGDVLELNVSTPPQAQAPQEASLRLRAPQAELDRMLADLSDLGDVTRQTITAEDVSEQLVDLTARVRNLRRAETTLLQLMERTGSVADVLQVAQELNNTRTQIERLEAQRQNLQQRVAFSQVTLWLELGGPLPRLTQPLGRQLGNTWEQAWYSVGRFTLGLLRLGLWLLAYSPYWLAIALLTWFFLGRRRPRPHPPAAAPAPEGEPQVTDAQE